METDMSSNELDDYKPPQDWASAFNEDLGPDPFQDTGGIPASAEQHAQRYNERSQAAAQARRLAVLREDNERYLDEEARQRVNQAAARGETPSEGDQRRAARAIARDPSIPRPSTAARLAAPAVARFQRQAQDQNDDRAQDRARRAGLRPRS
jgi:hypothetical protein